MEGATDSDFPTQFSEPAHAGVKRDTLGVGKGARERAPVQGAEVSEIPRTLLDTTFAGDSMETSDILAQERERAPADRVMDSDTPTQSADKKSRLGELHLAVMTNKEVVEEHAQWSRSEMKEKIDT